MRLPVHRCRYATGTVIASLFIGLAGASAANAHPADTPSSCTFTNPIARGADPSVVHHQGAYYLIESHNRAIYVYRSDRLTDPKRDPVQVWAAPDAGWNRFHVWAPELHQFDGRWYIYYSASAHKGPPFTGQRIGVLESTGSNPQGPYVDRGQLYTGDDVQTGADNKWAIDLTVARIGGRLVAIWSGWERNAATDKTPQHLYAARMASPTRIASNRTRISSPTAAWERGTELDLQEGPSVLTRAGQTFIVYSTRESWLSTYRLGLLRLASPDADPTDAASWIKSSGPVFEGTDSIHGAGHASYTVSLDGTEDWIVYHAKSELRPGWTDRVLRTQRFTWKTDGSPDFGVPVPTALPIAQPAGQCR